MPGAVIAIARKGQLAYFETVGYRGPRQQGADAARRHLLDRLHDQADGVGGDHDAARRGQAVPVRSGRQIPAQARQHAAGRHQDRRRRQDDRRDRAGGAPAHHPGPAAAHGGLPLRRPRRHGRAQAVAGLVVQPAVTYTGPEFIDALAKAPLAYQPGTVWDYSLAVDVLRPDRRGDLGQAARRLPGGAHLEAARHGRHGLHRARCQEGPLRAGIPQRPADRASRRACCMPRASR